MGETISLPASATHYAVASDLVIPTGLTIAGAGARSTVIDGMHDALRVFEVTGGPVTITGVTITGGKQGGIVLGGASLTLSDVNVSRNGSEGTGAFGAGVEAGSGAGTSLTVSSSTIAENLGHNGGGISNDTPTKAVISDSTIADNRAGGLDDNGEGGGILANTRVELVNDTVVGNECFGGPGCGGGVEGEITAANTIIADNLTANEHEEEVAPGDCTSPPTDAGPNLESGKGCEFGAHSGFSNANPLLGPLADNGGPTETEDPAIGSQAIDHGSDSGCPATDQRGVPRPQGAACDIGAVERTTPGAGAPAVSAITSTGATLTATASPVFIGGSFSYRYGPTTAYGFTTPTSLLLEGFAGEPAVATLSGLEPATDYHVQLVVTTPDGSAASGDVTFTTAPAPPHPALPAAPSLSDVSQTAARWREGNRLAKTSTSRHRRTPPVGTTFKFALNEQASVKFSFTQRVTGREVGNRCDAATRGNRRRKACRRTVTVGVLAFTGHSGMNEVGFQGRISHSQRLRPGSYTLLITATNSAGQSSAPQKLSFTIVK